MEKSQYLGRPQEGKAPRGFFRLMRADVRNGVKGFASAMCEVYLLSPNSDPNTVRLKHFGFTQIPGSRATEKPLLDPLVTRSSSSWPSVVADFHETILSALLAVNITSGSAPLLDRSPPESVRLSAVSILSRALYNWAFISSAIGG